MGEVGKLEMTQDLAGKSRDLLDGVLPVCDWHDAEWATIME